MASSSLQICSLLLALAGFTILLLTTMSNRWKISDTTAMLVPSEWISEGLWMDCGVTDFGAMKCMKFAYMLSSEIHVQACRALMTISILLGFIAAVVSLLGLKCTNVGLSDEDEKMKVAVTGGFLFILGGNAEAEIKMLSVLCIAVTMRLNELNSTVGLKTLKDSLSYVLFNIFFWQVSVRWWLFLGMLQ
uniref:Claudin n=1 Tax=Pavo cristatus TaxID=9049 RepID=A0A8C9L9V8_PAVCR